MKKARLIFLIQFNGGFHFRERIFEVEEPKEHLSLKDINAIERKAHIHKTKPFCQLARKASKT